MSFRIVDIDHLTIRVADLDAGVATFRSLGFTVPPARRPVDMEKFEAAAGRRGATPPNGAADTLISNRHVLFQGTPDRNDTGNFLELIAIKDQLRMPPYITQSMGFMGDSEGPKAIVCLTDDLEQAREEMIADGIMTSQTLELETGWDDEETGRFVEVKGYTTIPVHGQTPFMVNPCAHGIVESLHYERWTQHANSATSFAGVTGITERIEEHAQLMAKRVFGVEPEWESHDVAVIRPRDLVFRILTPAAFERLYPNLDLSRELILPALAGATVAVQSLDTARDALSANGIDHVETSAGVAVPRHLAANTIVEFIPAADS